jgi:hypothetical protein
VVHDGQFYLAIEEQNGNPLMFQVSRIRIHPSPSAAPAHDIQTSLRPVPAPPNFSSAPETRRFNQGTRMYTPKYGVALITRGSFHIPPDANGRIAKRQTAVYFWPAAPTGPSSDSELEFGPLCLYEPHCNISRLFPGSTRMCALITYYDQQKMCGALGLLQYVQACAELHVVFRALHTPNTMSPNSELLLDDALGIVYTIDRNRLSVVAYV